MQNGSDDMRSEKSDNTSSHPKWQHDVEIFVRIAVLESAMKSVNQAVTDVKADISSIKADGRKIFLTIVGQSILVMLTIIGTVFWRLATHLGHL